MVQCCTAKLHNLGLYLTKPERISSYHKKIEELIDSSKELLEALAAEDDVQDEYLGKDMQFHKIRLNLDWKKVEEEYLSEEYESENEPDEEDLGPEPVYNVENPRRSTRKRT